MPKWDTFAQISGGSAAALTGLLVVAVSIRIEVIASSQELRNRAAQTLTLFATVLLVALLLSIPDQAYWVLGAELLVLDAVTVATLLFLDWRAKTAPDVHTTGAIAAMLQAAAPNSVTSILLFLAGGLLVAGIHAGLYLLVSPVLIALAGGVVSTWLLLTRIPPRD